MDINRIELEDHPEYWDFVVQHLTVLENKLRAEGAKEDKIQREIIKERKRLGL